MSYVKDIGGQQGKRIPPNWDISSETPPQNKGKSVNEVQEARVTGHTLNTIARGFTGRGEPTLSRKRYAREVMYIQQKLISEEGENPTIISFSRKYVEGLLDHENGQIVIKVQIHD